MTHQFTEVQETGYGTRLRNAVFGVVVGLIMIVSAFVLLFWNEERGLLAERALTDALKAAVAVSAYSLDPANNGRLVHLSGPSQTDRSVVDPVVRLSVSDVLRLRRRVEMVQWHERTSTTTTNELGGGQTTRTTYTYALEWSEQPIGSANFRYFDGHQNPRMPMETRTFDAADARIGAYGLTPAALERIGPFRPRFVDAGELGRADGFVTMGEYLYRGKDPAQLTLGDVRLRYEVVPNGPYSIMGRQTEGTIDAYRDPDGYELLLVEPGDLSADALIDNARYAEEWTTWIMRLVGFLMMTFGFLFILGPLPALAAVIPFLGDVVGTGTFLVALMLGIPLTALTIAGSWLFLRPLWALAMLALAGLAVVGLYRVSAR